MCAHRRAEKKKKDRKEDWRKEIKVPKKGWKIRQVEVIYLPPPVTCWAPLRYSTVTA